MGTSTPQRLGDFEILREIGRGGMGVVYEARQVSLNRKVALKVLSGGLGLTARAVQRFRREAEAAARLHHTNIVPVYATGEHDGSHFYAMELIEGPSLDRVIGQLRESKSDTERAAGVNPAASSPSELAATGPYTPKPAGPVSGLESSSLGSDSHYFDTVAHMVAEVADALDYAHQQGVIHRDIKPSNLLLSPAGRLSVNDFGLARLLEQPGMTLTGEFVGTPAYMSPEQIAAGRTPLDHRTDIYSLGATLYELLTLQPPFRGERRDQLLAQILHKEPKAPRKLNRRVPVDLETICLKAVEKDPDRRYQTAGQMAEDLRRYVNRFAIAARRAGPVERLKKWAKRHPGLVAGLACAALAVAAASYFAVQAHLAEERRRVEREEQAKELLAEKRRNALDKAMAAAMAGDFGGAEKAIAEAELLEASAGQVRMLRGQVALHRGHGPEAVDHLREAVKLLPESVAARSMLAVAYGNSLGQWDKYQDVMREVEQLTPRTPEDYLFKGHAEAQWDRGAGLQTLQEAFRRRPSLMAYLLRADAELNLATDLTDPTRAERVAEAAVRDAEAAKRLLPGNAFALWTSLYAHLTTAIIYGETRQPDKRAQALARAEEDARALEPFSAVPDACFARFVFLREEGKEDTILTQLGRTSEQTGRGVAALGYALLLYRRKEFTATLGTLEKRRGHIFFELLRPVVLAEVDGSPTRALAAYQELAALNLKGWSRFYALLILRLLGHKAESEALCVDFGKHLDQFPPARREHYRLLLEYAAGKLSAGQLLRATAASRQELCVAHLYVAVTALAEGDRGRARLHFRKALATRAWIKFAYDLSWAFLARMEQDPNWPPWIPVKK
jgi:serine/threonine protein kinase